ncbi:MAG: 3-deoxy-D-manno-octulosonic acid transferase [Candidatus Omnitrophota bacterium]|nr:3-deoxy-D-manno-octulosonic acid transferase [Candidatus Omnitrophota bacterium]
MTFLYNIAYAVFGILYLPVFVSKCLQADSPRRLLMERFGVLGRSLRVRLLGQKVIWLHAVSVGEVMAVKNFTEMLLDRYAGHHLVLTTVTATGQKIAKELESDKITVCYFPFDLTRPVRSFFEALQPVCVLLAETEIWPNLLTEARRARVPVGIINARMSARSARRYMRFGRVFRPLMSKLDFVLAQSESDAAKFIALGVDSDRVQVLGNMKYDNSAAKDSFSPDRRRCVKKADWGFPENALVLMGGSTHPGEEELMCKVFKGCKESHPNLRMILAPRHIERSKVIARKCEKRLGQKVVLATQTDGSAMAEILVLDRLGILKDLYAIADVVFVGGSLVRHGGQNPIEPADQRRAIVHGPHVFNFEHIYQKLDTEGGAVLVRDGDELAFAVERLLARPGECKTMGEHAYEQVCRYRGATTRHVEWLVPFLESHDQLPYDFKISEVKDARIHS